MHNEVGYYKGKYFQSEDEYAKFADKWPKLKTDSETFTTEWQDLGKNLWFNIQIYREGMLNDELEDILSHIFLELTEKIFAKTRD